VSESLKHIAVPQVALDALERLEHLRMQRLLFCAWSFFVP
jgi:hypothetical protein